MKSMAIYGFAGFQLLAGRRRLLSQGQPVKLGSRAYDLLETLVLGRDRVLTKAELLEHAWPGLIVEEANLAVQVLALRGVLGREAIATVPGRGYRFTLPVQVEGDASAAVPAAPAALSTGAAAPSALAPGRGHLPLRTDELLGRERESHELLALMGSHRLVTLLGSGGVGKTRLAQHVAQALQPRFAEGVWWVELASLATPTLVAATVAQVLRTSPGPHRDSASAVAATLRAGPALLVLDNAEHVLDGVQALVATVLTQAPQARVLITSQAPLRVVGEQIMRLPSLSLPDDDSLEAARLSGAVGLFEARAHALDPAFHVDEKQRAAVVDICRRVDGIPLAIEFAVARLPLLGLQGLQRALHERLRVLTVHARGTVPRHQTLRAALDWSHGLLSAPEQAVLRRVGVFAGSFTLEAAQRVAADGALDEWTVLDLLGSLIDKSLVLADGPAVPRYRLLETTRLYALERLDDVGERAAVQQRHARALDHALQVPPQLALRDPRRWRTPPAAGAALVAELDNARAALDWAEAGCDDLLALSLAAGTSHVFLAASLNAEYLQRVLPLRKRAGSGLLDAVAGLFWARIALACSRNAHPAGLDAGLRAAEIYRRMGDAGRLYDALTWCIAIGSRVAAAETVLPLVDEAAALEQADWPAAARSSFQWARHRWLQQQGRSEEALRCAHAQAELLSQGGQWAMHVAWGANVADCELSLGRVESAAARSTAALRELDALGIDENIVGHVMDTLMVALTLLGRAEEALRVGRRARRLLEREGDELRLLDTLALSAAMGGRWPDAARIAGHADAALAARGETRWPSAAQRRERLAQQLAAALGPALQAQLSVGALLSLEAAFALAFESA
jgi:predicted ATPase/DNA-binding winged helix-turn-helix (wHTH) protein